MPGFFSLSAFNFLGSTFDARRALYDAHCVPPEPRAAPLDSVHKAQVLVLPELADTAVRVGRVHNVDVQERDEQYRGGEARAT